MRPVISLTLPSVHEDALAEAIGNIAAATTYPCELVVVSSFKPPSIPSAHIRIAWVKESARSGCSAAHAAGALAASGELILAWADDHLFTRGWDQPIVAEFRAREALFKSMAPGPYSPGPYSLGLRRHGSEYVGTEFGIYYPYFPLMRLSDVQKIGWLGKEWRKGFGDSDLALRVWTAGGRCEWSTTRVVMTGEHDKRKVTGQGEEADDAALFHADDMKLFVERWAPRYGWGWDTSHLRGFNLDVVPETIPHLVDWSSRSIYCNQPSFRAAAGFK